MIAAQLHAVIAVLALWGVVATARWVRHERSAEDRAHALRLAAVAFIALGARWFVGPFTPADLRFRLVYAYNPPGGAEDLIQYGMGFPMLMRWVILAGGGEHEVMVANAAIGALTVLPLAGFLSALGASRSAQLWSGLVLASMPLHIRFSASDGQFAVDGFLAMILLWSVARFARDRQPRWMVLASLTTILLCQIRLESVTTALAAALLTVALGRRWPWRDPWPWAAALSTGLALVPHIATSVVPMLGPNSSARPASGAPDWPPNVAFYVFQNPEYVSPLVIGALFLGMAFGRVSWPVRLWLVVVMYGTASLLDHAPVSVAFTLTRYQVRAVPYAAMLAGLGIAATSALLRRPRDQVLVALVASVGLASNIQIARKRSLPDREFALFTATLPTLGDCTIVAPIRGRDSGLQPPAYQSWLLEDRHQWYGVDQPPADLLLRPCRVYYRPALCFLGGERQVETQRTQHGQMRQDCAGFEHSWRLTPINERIWPADPVSPTGGFGEWTEDNVVIGFYRIDAPIQGSP